MSTQLILYPQTYDGTYNSVATPVLHEYIVDGINFTSINGSYTTGVVGTGSLNSPSALALAALPPNAPNTWYRYRTTTPGTPDYPTQTGNNLLLEAVTTSPLGDNGSGVYQRLSNLVAGVHYEVTINLTNNVLGTYGHLSVRLFDGNNLTNSNIIYYQPGPSPSFATVLNISFLAYSTQDVLMVSYFHATAWSVTINSISVKEKHGTPSLIYSELNDGQVICDLYQEEDIPLSLSIDDFKNVAEQVKSYSKDFNLPATKRNNKIFNNMFEVTRADDFIVFNPYLRTQCVLKQDGFILFEGYLRLVDIKDKDGEISYNVNLYSDVITLVDILKDKTFSDLDFTELEHNYNKDSIKESWNDGGWADIGLPLLNTITSSSFAYDSSLSSPSDHTSVLKYPFIDWTHQFLVGGSGSGSAAAPGYPELTTLETMFRPCIQLKYLINKIFADTGFSWTSDFFDTTVGGGGSFDFDKLYMDFNWGSGNSPVNFNTTGESMAISSDPNNYATLSYTVVLFPHDFWGGTFPWTDNSGFDPATSIFTAIQDNTTYQISYDIMLYFSGTTDVIIEWVSTTSGVMNQTIISGVSGDYPQYTGYITTTLNTGDTLFCRFKAANINSVKQNNNVVTGAHIFGIISSSVFTTGTLLQTLRGELGQWDFLKGIMTMFNLVSLVDESNPKNIQIEPYANVFINNTNSGNTGDLTLASRGIQHDWTDKVDVSEMELKPLTDLNKETLFQFVEDDDDYAFQVYKKATSGPNSKGLYGSSLQDASGFTILEGEKDIIAEPFASTVVKPLMSQFTDFVVPSVYAMNDDGTTEGFENSPRIFYDNGVKDTGVSYYIPPQNGLGSENQESFLQFSHLSTIPSVSATTKDFVFKSHQLPVEVGNPPTDNLYRTYWQPYFNELYHPDTRIMTLKVNLNPSDVASFKFYDTVFIKNRTFRVNRIDYKPNDLATVEFILIA
jgi:hypothetical protein